MNQEREAFQAGLFVGAATSLVISFFILHATRPVVTPSASTGFGYSSDYSPPHKQSAWAEEIDKRNKEFWDNYKNIKPAVLVPSGCKNGPPLLWK